MTAQVRVQIISEAILVQALKENADSEVSLSDHHLQDNDLHVGLVEVAAVVALATSIAQLAELLVKVYSGLSGDDPEIILKTANGMITVRGKDLQEVKDLMERLKEIQ